MTDLISSPSDLDPYVDADAVPAAPEAPPHEVVGWGLLAVPLAVCLAMFVVALLS